MEKLIFYLFIIVAVIYVVGLILSVLISIGFFILGGVAAVGAISGIVVSIVTFFEVLIEAHKTVPYRRNGAIISLFAKVVETQPSYAMYAFYGGWNVMEYVRDNVFSRTQAAANFWFTQGNSVKVKGEYASNTLYKYYFYSAYAGCWLAGISQYVSALMVVAVFFVLQMLILTIWMIAATIAMGLLAGVNFLYGNYYKIFFRCPECHEQMSISVYVCPTCAAEHTRLWPSVYGVFHHACANCETRLPTLDILGRKELTQKCVSCKSPMNKEIGRLINIHIPVIGGPSTGKSNYIFMATNHFIEKYANPRGIEVAFPDERHKRDYENNLKLLSSGIPLIKTPDVVPQAYNLSIKKHKDRIGRIIYIYDAAGEAYASEINVIQQKPYFNYIHGLIFIIDPFSIEQFARLHENEIDPIRKAIRPSTLGVMDAYERMIVVLESSFGVKKGEKFKSPLAVIISKTDALNLENKIGRTAAQALMKKDLSIRLETDAIDILVEEFLQENGLGNFVRDVKMQFGKVSFFSCSALGRLPDPADHRPYEPIGILDPFLWLLGEMGVVGWIKERSQMMDREHQRMASARGNLFEKAKYYIWDSLTPREK